jgi:hypothetical protein
MNKQVEKLLTFGNIKPVIVGSAGLGIKNYGDVDINVNIPYKYKDEVIERIKEIEKLYYLTEIKIQNKDKKIKHENTKNIEKDINELTDMIKIDFKIFTDKELDAYEALIFFDEGLKKKISIRETLMPYLYEGNYWKLLKRMLSIARYKKDNHTVNIIKDYIDSEIGEVGRYMSLLETIEELDKAFNLGDKLKDMKKSLNEKIDKIILKDRIYFRDKEIKKNPKSWINYKAKEFIRQHNLF